MKIRIIAPIVGDRFNREILEEASLCKSPDTEIDVKVGQKIKAGLHVIGRLK